MSRDQKKPEQRSSLEAILGPPINPDELIRISDFESMRIRIEVQNTTTRTEVPSSASVELLEILEKGAILGLPARSCSRGHNLLVRFRGITADKEGFEFVSTCKVEQVEDLGDSSQERITLNFLQFDEIGWENFCARFNSRQDEIENFLKAAKGL